MHQPRHSCIRSDSRSLSHLYCRPHFQYSCLPWDCFDTISPLWWVLLPFSPIKSVRFHSPCLSSYGLFLLLWYDGVQLLSLPRWAHAIASCVSPLPLQIEKSASWNCHSAIIILLMEEIFFCLFFQNQEFKLPSLYPKFFFPLPLPSVHCTVNFPYLRMFQPRVQPTSDQKCVKQTLHRQENVNIKKYSAPTMPRLLLLPGLPSDTTSHTAFLESSWSIWEGLCRTYVNTVLLDTRNLSICRFGYSGSNPGGQQGTRVFCS